VLVVLAVLAFPALAHAQAPDGAVVDENGEAIVLEDPENPLFEGGHELDAPYDGAPPWFDDWQDSLGPGGGWEPGSGPTDVDASIARARKRGLILRPDGRVRTWRRVPRTVRRVVAAANRIAHTPYRYGGGHASFTDSAYDCSGSVSYALHGAGLLHTTLVSGQLAGWGARGRGDWITIYANDGHVFMTVAGLRYDTSGRTGTETRWQPMDRSTSGFAVRHPPGL
jgi:hypothetical protein